MVAASEIEAGAVRAGLAGGGPHGGVWGEWKVREVARGVDLVVTGVGKANAAGAAGLVLAGGGHGRVLVVGIAGVLPGCGLRIGSAAAIERAVLADEGVETGAGFVSMDALGFPPVPSGCSIPADAGMLAALERLAARASVATVSTCSGTDARASEVARRTGAGLEDMETGAVGVACARLGVAWGGIRVVSNTTGERARQVWEMSRALDEVKRIIGPAIDALRAMGP